MPLNLFRPSFGTYPHLLVGRQAILDDFEDAFDGITDPSGLTVLLSGQRGMGKTVLLDAYRKAAEGADWVVVTESSSDGILARLTSDHLPRLLQRFADEPRHKLSSANLTVGPGGGGASWVDRYPAESTLRAQIAELTDALAAAERGLLITVDEVQSADIEELRKLGEIIQYARREERPLAFAAAGLSTPVEELLDHPGATFLRRAEHHSVGPVGRTDVRTAIAQTTADSGREIDLHALEAAADAADGYPFMIQLVGHHTLKAHKGEGPITTADTALGIEAARRRLGRHVHTPALRPLSDVDRTYLLAMAQDVGPSRTRDIAERMHVTTDYAAQYRRRLIRDGIVEAAGHGYVRFAIPYMAEHLREHAAHDVLERMDPEDSASAEENHAQG